MLLPQELKTPTFNRGIRGYVPEEVDEHIRFLKEKYADLYRENTELSRKLATALSSLDALLAREDKVTMLEKEMKRTAAALLADGERRGRQIVDEAAAYAEELVSEADAHVAAQQARYEEIKEKILALEAALLSTYASHTEAIRTLSSIAAEAPFFDPAEADGLPAEGAPAPVIDSPLGEDTGEEYQQQSFGAEVYPEEGLADAAAEEELLEIIHRAVDGKSVATTDAPAEPEEDDVPWEEPEASTPPSCSDPADEELLRELHNAFVNGKSSDAKKEEPVRPQNDGDDEWLTALRQLEATLAVSED